MDLTLKEVNVDFVDVLTMHNELNQGGLQNGGNTQF
jgi:hypothetical protein